VTTVWITVWIVGPVALLWLGKATGDGWWTLASVAVMGGGTVLYRRARAGSER
jgi:hypothetical protein